MIQRLLNFFMKRERREDDFNDRKERRATMRQILIEVREIKERIKHMATQAELDVAVAALTVSVDAAAARVIASEGASISDASVTAINDATAKADTIAPGTATPL